LLFLLAFCFIQSFSQRTETSLNVSSSINRLYLEIENDMLFQTDSYYTAGIALSLTNKNLKKSPAQFLFKLNKHKILSFSGFGIQQRIFTPYSITAPNSIANDQPYSAYLLIFQLT